MGKLRPEKVLNLAKQIQTEGAGIPVHPGISVPQEIKKRIPPPLKKKQNKNLGVRGMAQWVRTDSVKATGHKFEPLTSM